MKKLIFILIVLASCKSDSERNLLMTTLINNQKSLNDSLDYFKRIDANAKLAVDTLSDSELLRLGSSFLQEKHKIRMGVLPTIEGIEEKLKSINYSIDSLSKMK
jgi:hypothetical protein